jgi:hypothetical protein
VLLIGRPGGGQFGPTMSEVHVAHYTAQRIRQYCSLRLPPPILSTGNAMNRIIDISLTNHVLFLAGGMGGAQLHAW